MSFNILLQNSISQDSPGGQGSLGGRGSRRAESLLALAIAGIVLACAGSTPTFAQTPDQHVGETVPRDVREMYDHGLQYLASTQTPEGGWNDGQPGPAVTGLALMSFLASGEDPNFGIYSSHVKKALRNIISSQNTQTGFLGNSMYNHGFGMLALAESYGAVDDRNLWSTDDKEARGPIGKSSQQRTIGQALELAVRCAVTSQKKNTFGGWRYSPDATDADTSVSGAVLVGLLAARNAGIEVPDECIDKAVAYYQSMTASSGQVAYSGGIGGFDESLARISIGCLAYSLAHRKDLPQFKATLAYLTQRLEQAPNNTYPEYTRYYEAQALFQGDVDSWEKWNRLLVRELKQQQQSDGSFNSQYGRSLGTSMGLLSLALNYRFLPIYER